MEILQRFGKLLTLIERSQNSAIVSTKISATCFENRQKNI